jgi:hypothetical protein
MGDTHTRYRHTDCWEGFRKYAIEVGLGAMIHIPGFIKTEIDGVCDT